MGRGSVAEKMPALEVRTVEVLERARLLDHEHGRTRPVEVVDLARREVVEARETPGDHAVASGVFAFARCSQVSTTVSGLRDMDSMPSCISHSARSG